MDIQTALITAVKCLIRVFSDINLDRSTGLGSDRITERKFWTGLGFQNSPICSTLIVYRFTQCCLTKLYILQKIKQHIATANDNFF